MSGGKVAHAMKMAEHYTKNDSTMVKNINGTADDRFKVDNLFQRYLAAGGGGVAECSAKGCHEPASKTAHAHEVDKRADTHTWLLCRVCATHNHHTFTGAYALQHNARLVRLMDVTHN